MSFKYKSYAIEKATGISGGFSYYLSLNSFARRATASVSFLRYISGTAINVSSTTCLDHTIFYEKLQFIFILLHFHSNYLTKFVSTHSPKVILDLLSYIDPQKLYLLTYPPLLKILVLLFPLLVKT